MNRLKEIIIPVALLLIIINASVSSNIGWLDLVNARLNLNLKSNLGQSIMNSDYCQYENIFKSKAQVHLHIN